MTTTESFSDYNHLEKKTTSELLQIINKEDKTVPLIIEKSLKEISALIDKVFERMVGGGRLFYIGSGTPGRLGIVDASECPPTFGVDNNVIIGIIRINIPNDFLEGIIKNPPSAIAVRIKLNPICPWIIWVKSISKTL